MKYMLEYLMQIIGSMKYAYWVPNLWNNFIQFKACFSNVYNLIGKILYYTYKTQLLVLTMFLVLPFKLFFVCVNTEWNYVIFHTT